VRLNLAQRLSIIVIITAIAWCTSITNEFVGYDDIKLIVRNDRIQESVFYAINFYYNVVSDSHNIAWTNYPTVIFRPLEWVGSSIAYHIWGAKGWAFHLFVNFTFHIINSVLIFFILSKLFHTHCNKSESQLIEVKVNENKSKKTKLKSVSKILEIKSISWFLPLVITMIWAVHPLHNEAVNMLTSGVGYLWATMFSLTAFLIFLHVQDLSKLRSWLLLAFAWFCAFAGYHGSEMTVIAPIVLLIVFWRSMQNKDFRAFGHERLKFFIFLTSVLVYLNHRSHIVSEKGEWLARGYSEFFERLLVLAPQIFTHYLKLFFFPKVLTIDEHHEVVLANAFSAYHVLCFVICLSFLIGVIYFAFNKDRTYELHDKFIAGFLFFSGFSLAMSLNIIPLYALARDRYTYFFTLSIVVVIMLVMDKYYFSRVEISKSTRNILLLILVVVVGALSARSIVKSLDWSNGERFWSSTMNTVQDLGAKQNWRYRLMQYYEDPGTTTFKPNSLLKEQAYNDFYNWERDNHLSDPAVINRHIADSKNPDKYLLNKYGYIGNKSIASGLFFVATEYLKRGQNDEGVRILKLSHIYYPEHFQTNLQLLIYTYGQNAEMTNYLLAKMFNEAINNSFLAKGFMDGMFFMKHPQTLDYALKFVEKFPNTQVFHVYCFHAAMAVKDYEIAYRHAKAVANKYTEQDIFVNFIRQYEAGIVKN
jgi:hypothetical protein